MPAKELSREAIVDAASALLREVGAQGLSMRRLAAHLNVTATALYYHIGSRDELLDAVITALLRAVAPADETAPWSQALEDLLVRLQYLFSDYPGLQRFMAEHLESAATLTWMEILLQALKAGGLDDEETVMAVNVLGFYNSAVPLRGQRGSEDGPWEPVRTDRMAASAAIQRDAYPTLSELAHLLRPPDETVFRAGLRALIAGLERPGAE